MNRDLLCNTLKLEPVLVHGVGRMDGGFIRLACTDVGTGEKCEKFLYQMKLDRNLMKVLERNENLFENI